MPQIENDYSFQAHERSYELPHRVCEILEEIYAVRPDGGYVHSGTHNVTAYLLRLCFVADAWKEKNAHGLVLEERIDGSRVSSIDELIKSRQIADAITHDFASRDQWQTYRTECLQKFDRNTFLELERLLGIDSLGIEANDNNPFLGANIDRIGAASTYCESIVPQKEARMRVLRTQQDTRDRSEKTGALDGNLPNIFATMLHAMKKWLRDNTSHR